jgi:hypothetical protein
MNIIEACEAIERGERVQRVYGNGSKYEIVLSCSGTPVYRDASYGTVPITTVTRRQGAFEIITKPKKRYRVKSFKQLVAECDGYVGGEADLLLYQEDSELSDVDLSMMRYCGLEVAQQENGMYFGHNRFWPTWAIEEVKE